MDQQMANEIKPLKNVLCYAAPVPWSPYNIIIIHTLMYHNLGIKKLHTYLSLGIDSTSYIMVITYTKLISNR